MPDGRHDCPGRCGRRVSRHMLSCRYCWPRLPQPLKTAVLEAHAAKRRNPTDRAAGVAHRQAVGEALIWYRDNATGGGRG